jgi:hypothetical protein
MSLEKQLLNDLKTNVYCRLGVSKIAPGDIGVIAIKDIPSGVNPFKTLAGECIPIEIVTLSKNDVEELEPEIKKLITDFCHESSDGYPVPKYGPNSMTISQYLNHSKEPNIGIKFYDECQYNTFISLKEIKKGDELTFNYGDFGNLTQYKINY